MPTLSRLRPLPSTSQAPNYQGPPAAAALAADELVCGINDDEGASGAVERPAGIALTLIVRYTERLQRRLSEPDRGFLTAVE